MIFDVLLHYVIVGSGMLLCYRDKVGEHIIMCTFEVLIDSFCLLKSIGNCATAHYLNSQGLTSPTMYGFQNSIVYIMYCCETKGIEIL